MRVNRVDECLNFECIALCSVLYCIVVFMSVLRFCIMGVHNQRDNHKSVKRPLKEVEREREKKELNCSRRRRKKKREGESESGGRIYCD